MPVLVFTISKIVGPMYNKRLLLLGIILVSTCILSSGWMYPSAYADPAGRQLRFEDTDRVAGLNAAPAVFTSPSEIAFNQLFTAATLGGNNGVRLNPKAISFVQDYMKENWDELQNVRSYGRPYFTII